MPRNGSSCAIRLVQNAIAKTSTPRDFHDILASLVLAGPLNRSLAGPAPAIRNPPFELLFRGYYLAPASVTTHSPTLRLPDWGRRVTVGQVLRNGILGSWPII